MEIPSEKALYDTAHELIRNRQYEMATEQLQATIESYPNGRLSANVYYWLGQAYAAMPRPEYEKSRQALTQVIAFYPEHQKVPDAAFKLGTVHHLLGDCSRARELLNQVIEQHPVKLLPSWRKTISVTSWTANLDPGLETVDARQESQTVAEYEIVNVLISKWGAVYVDELPGCR